MSMELKHIGDKLKRGKLKWSGHVGGIQEDNWVNRLRNMNINGRTIVVCTTMASFTKV